MKNIAESIRNKPAVWDINEKMHVRDSGGYYKGDLPYYNVRHGSDTDREFAFQIRKEEKEYVLITESGAKPEPLDQEALRELYYAAQEHVSLRRQRIQNEINKEFEKFYKNVK